jgi:branched-subunit amino acid ABC-type transport system permease component
VWVALDLMATYKPEWQAFQSLYTWGWAIAIVAAAFVLLAIFCLRVIRQRFPRIGLLLAAFALFLLLSQLSEKNDWDRQLAMMWWDDQTGSGLIAGNLDHSSDPGEEQWREQLRQMQRRSQSLRSQGTISAAAVSAVPTTSKQTSSAKSSKAMIAQAGSSSSKAPRLPSSGFGMEGMAIMLAAACCTAVHKKTVKRSKIN